MVIPMLDLDGYLGKSGEQVKAANYKAHERLFALCFQINRFCQIFKYELTVDENDHYGIVATLLFFKLHDTYQTVVLLYLYGLDSQARILNRSMLEGLWVLKSLYYQPEETFQLLMEDEYYKKLNLLHDIKNNRDYFYEYITKNKLLNIDSEISKLEAKMKSVGIKKVRKINVKEMALKTYSDEEYYYIYKLLCRDVHVDTGQLTDYFITDEKGKITGFRPYPSTNNIEEILLTTAELILKAVIFLSKILNIDKKSEIKYYINQIQKF